MFLILLLVAVLILSFAWPYVMMIVAHALFAPARPKRSRRSFPDPLADKSGEA